jgi:agmatinase
MKVVGPTSNFLAIEKRYSTLEASKVAIVSAPYEHTVSYGGGTKRGPKGVIDASAYVEFYDDETQRELCFDVGIATLKPLAFGKKSDRAALDIIEEQVDDLLAMDKFVVTIGGEHTISTAPIASHYRKYPSMSILHFDAHADLRESYQGSKYSHACFMARVAEFFPPKLITQVGIRALCKEEAAFIKKEGVNTFFASSIRRGMHGANWQQSVVDTLAKDVYITFDVDAFDPSVMPATGTPEPDGLFYSETIDVIRAVIASGRRIVGLDIVELAPDARTPHADLTTARLLYKILNLAMTPAPKRTSTKPSTRRRS